jgi:hypothetical protein
VLELVVGPEAEAEAAAAASVDTAWELEQAEQVPAQEQVEPSAVERSLLDLFRRRLQFDDLRVDA